MTCLTVVILFENVPILARVYMHSLMWCTIRIFAQLHIIISQCDIGIYPISYSNLHLYSVGLAPLRQVHNSVVLIIKRWFRWLFCIYGTANMSKSGH